ncbi:serine hydrolase [Nostoc sp. 'Peltigera malacea cyanobiont' DB3992]|uniref:serine hydrolase n=1 Tax=Nostoc sp. 'Peltigera malacea cyanobiont' DB3992 TaxID=1206980 RepID=UPI000C054EA9|nr:serine hydrolase [Nostoc sp. 'Peltigera malacea cyanobiont' DB3992]PHM08335.1 serine hydrolase [Nostoc sp. 'Peltigera malacea cyanobiont' DB3992]
MKSHLLAIGLSSLVLVAGQAKASQLQSWYYDSSQNQLDLTTTSGIEPKAFLLDNPNRLVIDLPGTNFNSDTVKRSFGKAVKEIRLGKPDSQTTRFVVELAPGYDVTSQNISVKGDSRSHWSFKFNSFNRQNNPLVGENREDIAIRSTDASTFAGVVNLGQEMAGITSQIRTLLASYKSLNPGIFFLDLDTGNYIDINGEKRFAAASTIKFPLLVALFQEIDAGRIKLSDKLVMRRDLKVGESGIMQYKPIGTKFSVLETATLMMTISDNTATNLVLDRLGGAAKVSQRFRSWGLQNTAMQNLLPDIGGTNTTSSKDLVRLAALVSNNRLLSPASRNQVLGIMRRVKTNSLLPAGIGQGATIAHKTGTLRFIIGDAGIIQMPNGKSYLAGVLVQRPNYDRRAGDFVREVSRRVYNYLDNTKVSNIQPILDDASGGH